MHEDSRSEREMDKGGSREETKGEREVRKNATETLKKDWRLKVCKRMEHEARGGERDIERARKRGR